METNFKHCVICHGHSFAIETKETSVLIEYEFPESIVTVSPEKLVKAKLQDLLKCVLYFDFYDKHICLKSIYKIIFVPS